MRFAVTLTEEQRTWLAKVCERDGISPADAIRRIIEDARQREWQEALSAVFAIWKDRNIDALEYERALREEWER